MRTKFQKNENFRVDFRKPAHLRSFLIAVEFSIDKVLENGSRGERRIARSVKDGVEVVKNALREKDKFTAMMISTEISHLMLALANEADRSRGANYAPAKGGEWKGRAYKEDKEMLFRIIADLIKERPNLRDTRLAHYAFERYSKEIDIATRKEKKSPFYKEGTIRKKIIPEFRKATGGNGKEVP